MSVVPAALFLVDFDSNNLAAAAAEETLREGAAVGADAGLQQRLDEAHARGVEEGRSAAEADAAARIEEQKAAAEQDLATARETWCREEGARIAEQVGAAVGDMENRIAEAVERILRPFLAQAAREQAVHELRTILQELVATSPGITLEISGPEDLLDAIRASLPACAGAVSYVANETCDVQVKAGASILETRIAQWLQSCEGRLT